MHLFPRMPPYAFLPALQNRLRDARRYLLTSVSQSSKCIQHGGEALATPAYRQWSETGGALALVTGTGMGAFFWDQSFD